ncbi:GNAT family N-acetyltransferase [Nocardia asteroides]|uniref:GNAT family N-acetyltransferase n=1 Tax=Nocardia asteroides TaxID=1824 RepID=UPI001E29E645|nr:GNAT family N-acetyltransferase [Nocardia asteroides]UGT61704.1 GNAT family N-acetyltransferase [Nocardia asteroides]
MGAALETARLSLRLFDIGDATELHEIFAEPAHTIGEGPVSEIAWTRGWIGRRMDAYWTNGLCWYGLRERASGMLLGNCGVFAGRTGVEEPEIGYAIRCSHRGHGLAREAAAAVLREALAAGVPRVWATIRPHNTASIRIAESVGLRCHSTRFDSKGPLLYLCTE